MKNFVRFNFVLLIAVLLVLASGCARRRCCSGPPLPTATLRAYVGTYTSGKSQGIYTFAFNPATGGVGELEIAATASNPSFLAIHPDRVHLYCVGDMTNAEGKKAGIVSAFSIQPNGKLTLLNQMSTVGAGPCHLTVDKSGRMLLAANYGGGSVVSFPIKADGSIGGHTGFMQHSGRSVTPRQAQPNAHSVNLSPDNRFAFVPDLGLDQVLTYKLDPTSAAFVAHDPPFVKMAPGSGPRHFCFHPGGKFGYVINEIAMTVTAFRFDAARGALTEMQTISTLPVGEGPTPQAGWSTAEIVAHPGGKFLYGSNRGHDTITVFAIASDGTLTQILNAAAEVKVPRNFALDPTGHWLFTEGQKSDDIALFRVDPVTGKLTFTGTKFEVGSPVCIKFLPLK